MVKLATVSYLNARPLIHGFESSADVTVIRRVPSRLLETLESGEADVALCPVVDFQHSSIDLEIVPSGAIGCDGPALTVMLFSRKPFERIEEIAVDVESHTSVALLQLVMREVFDLRPTLRPSSSRSGDGTDDAILLIGDKVITSAPEEAAFPFQLDLGRAWKELSGSPFVFATWMTRAGTELGDLPSRLDTVRRENHLRLDEIARRHAEADGWPSDLAVRYLSSNLRYNLDAPELAAIEEFWTRCHKFGIIDELRPMRVYRSDR